MDLLVATSAGMFALGCAIAAIMLVVGEVLLICCLDRLPSPRMHGGDDVEQQDFASQIYRTGL